MVNVIIYITDSCSPMFNMMQPVLSIVTCAPIPRKVTVVHLYVNPMPQSFQFPQLCKMSFLR